MRSIPPIAMRSFISVVLAAAHPSLSAPRRLVSGMRTSFRKISLKWELPVIWRRGHTSIPGDFMSSRK